MNYEKKYKEALERAMKYLYDTEKCMSTEFFNATERAMQEIFPELKKSEDEIIRKELIKETKGSEVRLFETVTNEEFIAWLEKQGSEPNWCYHKVNLSNCSEEYRKAYCDGWNNCNMQHSQCKSEGNDVVKCLINGMKFYYEGDEEATWGTEKFSMKVKDILSWLEKQGHEWDANKKELKKIEPKFKVGDKIKYNGDIYVITEVNKNWYDVAVLSVLGSEGKVCSCIGFGAEDKMKLVQEPYAGIYCEDFNGGEGYYKLSLDNLNKKQVEAIEALVASWNKK